jgi:molecular chaperone HtpG
MFQAVAELQKFYFQKRIRRQGFMTAKTGKISVTAENMLPIIKKWLYSEHDIFIRELVSNAMDAITKHKHLSLIGDAPQKDVDYRIEVATNESNKTIHIKDNGIGMTEEEVKKYIADIAFSGAAEFVERYKAGDESQQIIGHFGLGFYSSFMVADKVEVKTRSFKEDSKAVLWSCDGGTDYTIEELDENISHGTEIILHVNSESECFLKENELKSALKRHSEFLPVPIMFNGSKVNEQKPVWSEPTSSLKQEDYGSLYSHLFPFQEKPLFHIHFNIDTPFQIKGILYFQKVKKEYESFKGRIKLFCNHVFVSDSIEDLFPSYLFMLQGVLDCPDIPLNVSRSALQGDPRIRKIGALVTKKIADKLKEMFKKDREQYESFWPDINPFVKFAVLQDEKFYERVNEYVVFKTTEGDKYLTLAEYLEDCKEKHENKVYYVSDLQEQYSYVELFKSQDLNALVMDSVLDSHYVQHLEMKNPDVKFLRIDSELDEKLLDKDQSSKIVDQDNKTKEDKLKEIFSSAINKDKVTIRVEHLKSEDVSGMILLPEHLRRFQEMSALSMQQMPEFLEEHTFVINAENPIVKRVVEMRSSMREKEAAMICEHLYDLALMAHKQFEGQKMSNFIDRSNRILNIFAEK